MIIDKTHKIIKEENIHPKKMFGQNFLTNKDVLNDIVKAASLTKEDYVIEIGPGLGTLTEQLCLNSKKVLCYEIDNDLAALLPERLKDFDNFEIINEDFLKRDISKDIDVYFDGAKKVKLIANIPYNITSPIMLAVLKEIRIKNVVIMVQKELAERFSAKPNNKEYGSISAFLNFSGKCSTARIVSRNCFEPVPNVDSAVFCFERNKEYFEESYLQFLRTAFSQKRKKLTNNLNSIYDKAKVIKLLNDLGCDENIRAEALDANILYQLYQGLKNE